MEYLIPFVSDKLNPDCNWNSEIWSSIESAKLTNILPEGSGHNPNVKLKLIYNEVGFTGLFKVDDYYVRSTRTVLNELVARDSCVEFFVLPPNSKGYFNFEFNAGGCLLCSYITDHTRVGTKFKEYVMLKKEHASQVKICNTMPKVVEPEIKKETTWFLGFHIPFKIFGEYTGNPIENVSGKTWKANFYKCGDETSHPHWLTWSPVDALNFHLPNCFGNIKFQKV